MANFADDRSYSQVFHEGQLQHYGIRNGEAPQMNQEQQRADESRGRVPKRKAVGSAQRQKTQSAFSSSPSTSRSSNSTPPSRRKPVGSNSSQSTANSRAQSPAPTNRRHNPDLSKPLPRIPKGEQLPFIGRDTVGRFDKYSRTAEGSAPQSPVGHSLRAQIPAPARALLQSHAGSAPVSPRTMPEQEKRTSWNVFSRKRSDSNASIQSRLPSRQGSRRGSLKQMLEIVAMPKSEREAFVAGVQKEHDREIEQARRKDPHSRPDYQKKYLVQKQKAAKPGESWGLGPQQASYEAQMQQRAFHDRASAGYAARHTQEVEKADLEGRSRPASPDGPTWSPPTGSLCSEDRNSALQEATEQGIEEPRFKLGRGDDFALQLSALLDGVKLDRVKRNRKGSQSSDMDIGMTDKAPAGTIYKCGEAPNAVANGCGESTNKFLKEGLCDKCYADFKRQGK